MYQLTETDRFWNRACREVSLGGTMCRCRVTAVLLVTCVMAWGCGERPLQSTFDQLLLGSVLPESLDGEVSRNGLGVCCVEVGGGKWFDKAIVCALLDSDGRLIAKEYNHRTEEPLYLVASGRTDDLYILDVYIPEGYRRPPPREWQRPHGPLDPSASCRSGVKASLLPGKRLTEEQLAKATQLAGTRFQAKTLDEAMEHSKSVLWLDLDGKQPEGWSGNVAEYAALVYMSMKAVSGQTNLHPYMQCLLMPHPFDLALLLSTPEAFAGALGEGWNWTASKSDDNMTLCIRNIGENTVRLEVRWVFHSGLLRK